MSMKVIFSSSQKCFICISGWEKPVHFNGCLFSRLSEGNLSTLVQISDFVSTDIRGATTCTWGHGYSYIPVPNGNWIVVTRVSIWGTSWHCLNFTGFTTKFILLLCHYWSQVNSILIILSIFTQTSDKSQSYFHLLLLGALRNGRAVFLCSLTQVNPRAWFWFKELDENIYDIPVT